MDKLSTYNIMKNYTKDKLAEFINILISYGYLNYRGEYPVVTLNNKSMEIVKGQRQVFIKQVNVKQAVAKNNELFNILRVIRMEIASEEKIPPYICVYKNRKNGESIHHKAPFYGRAMHLVTYLQFL